MSGKAEKWAEVVAVIKTHTHTNPDGSTIEIRTLDPVRGRDQFGPYVFKKGRVVRVSA